MQITSAASLAATRLANRDHLAQFEDRPQQKPFDPPIPDPGPLASALRSSLLDAIALNPQPLPPRAEGIASRRLDFDWCGTPVPRFPPPLPQPQPQPPFGGIAAAAQFVDDDWCGTKPRPVPPQPWMRHIESFFGITDRPGGGFANKIF